METAATSAKTTSATTSTELDFEYLCRVCAVNTKGKNAVAECVYILKTPHLKEKLEKYLYLPIAENDELPKVLCKTCFRQVDATASLSKIAEHTQNVFQDFVYRMRVGAPSVSADDQDANSAEYTSISLISKDSEKPSLASTPATTPTCHKDEVVVNVSINDPLTRETQHKMISASQRRKKSLDTRFTPRSIAQRAFTSTPKPLEQTARSTPTPPLCSGSSAASKIKSPGGVISFFHGQPQQVTTFSSGGYVIGRMPAGADQTSNKNSNAVESSSNNKNNNNNNNNNSVLNKRKLGGSQRSGQVSLLKVSQKVHPKPQQSTASPTRNTIALPEDEAVEILPDKIIIAAAKQKRDKEDAAKAAAAVAAAEAAATEAVSQQQQEAQQQTAAAKTGFPEDIHLGKVIKDYDLLKLILKALKWPVDKHNMEQELHRLKNSKFTDIMSDANLLQDTDLTQILGPYLAPAMVAAHALQQQQRALAAAAAAAAAAQLTQSNALTAAGLASAIPYKLPAETSVQLVPASPESEDEPTTSAAAAAGKFSLKREHSSGPIVPAKKMRRNQQKPRDTSILISDEEDGGGGREHPHGHAHEHGRRRAGNSTRRTVSRTAYDPAVLAQFSMFTDNTGGGDNNTNNALFALLQRQREALSRSRRLDPTRRRSNSNIITVPASDGHYGLGDEDDIVLMEPQQSPEHEQELEHELEPEPETPLVEAMISAVAAAVTSTTIGASASGSALALPSNFVMPTQLNIPRITRPIIKRRKTVVQTQAVAEKTVTAPPPSAASSSVKFTNTTTTTANATSTSQQQPAVAMKSVATTAAASSSALPANMKNLPPMPPLQRKPSMAAIVDNLRHKANQQPSHMHSQSHQSTQMPSTMSVSTSMSGTALQAPVSSSSCDLPMPAVTHKSGVRKSAGSKSALGQQLLEAIGLQKVPHTLASDGGSGAVESVQQIRSALKRSLKQAQEQQQKQQRKQEEPIIQDADSTTTKNVVKEVLVEAKVKNSAISSTSSTTPLDVEEQIDRTELVLHSKANAEASTTKDTKEKAVTAPLTKKQTTFADERRDEGTESKITPQAAPPAEEEETVADVEAVQEHEDAVESAEPEVTERVPRKRGRKRKDEKPAIDAKDIKKDPEEVAVESNTVQGRTLTRNVRRPNERDGDRETDASNAKNEPAAATASAKLNSRPARVSKTLSKYYKGPGKADRTVEAVATTRTTRSRH